MAAFFVVLIVLLAMASHSNAAYCICKDGLPDTVLQKNIDYACGAGADCTPIMQNGACYNPNTVKDHCNWAVNSYYQRKGQTPLSCDFAGTATPSQTPPSQSSSCVYPASPGTTGTPTPSTGTPTTTIPGTPTTGTPMPGTGNGVPGSGTGTGTGIGTGTGTGTGTGIGGTPTTTIPGSTPGSFGLAPGGGGIGGTDSTADSMTLHQSSYLAVAIYFALFSLGLMFTWA